MAECTVSSATTGEVLTVIQEDELLCLDNPVDFGGSPGCWDEKSIHTQYVSSTFFYVDY